MDYFSKTIFPHYFSPNTHLLGEAVALHAIGKMLPTHSRSNRWIQLGSEITEQQIRAQVREDGSHFEQSTYYHVYALDMFLNHALLANTTEEYKEKLVKMASYLDAALGHDRRLPFLGDDDGGRWFSPYGPRDQFGRATLATCNCLSGDATWGVQESDHHAQASWWTPYVPVQIAAVPQQTTSFPNSGLCVLQHESSKFFRCRTLRTGLRWT